MFAGGRTRLQLHAIVKRITLLLALFLFFRLFFDNLVVNVLVHHVLVVVKHDTRSGRRTGAFGLGGTRNRLGWRGANVCRGVEGGTIES